METKKINTIKDRRIAYTSTVYIGNDYTQFKFHPLNRPASESQIAARRDELAHDDIRRRNNHLKAMVRNLKKNGFNPVKPILIARMSDGEYILDGQFRYLACMELDIPYYYTYHDVTFDTGDDFLEEAISLNS